MPKFIKTIKIITTWVDVCLKETKKEEELEVWRLPNGGLVGLDSSYLDQVSDRIICPYTNLDGMILIDEIRLPREEIDRVKLVDCEERDILGF